MAVAAVCQERLAEGALENRGTVGKAHCSSFRKTNKLPLASAAWKRHCLQGPSPFHLSVVSSKWVTWTAWTWDLHAHIAQQRQTCHVSRGDSWLTLDGSPFTRLTSSHLLYSDLQHTEAVASTRFNLASSHGWACGWIRTDVSLRMHRDGICLELRDLPCTTAQLASSTFVLWTTVETTLTQNSKHNGALRSKVACFEFGRVQGLRHASAAGFGAPWARDCLRGQICNCFWLEFQKQKHLVLYVHTLQDVAYCVVHGYCTVENRN